jgi:hypothetical protein
MILQKFWSAFVAQINKVANLFWEADPVAQMRYEYDRAVDQLKEGAAAWSSTAGWSSASRGRSRPTLPRPEARSRDQGLPQGRRPRNGGQVRARAAEGQRAAGGERAAAANARNGYGNNLKKIQHANEKLIELREKIQKYDAELKMSAAEAEIAKLSETFDMNLTTDFGEIESVIQQKIDQNRGKVRVAADLSERGIAEIKAEERMQGQLAEEALRSFEASWASSRRRRRRFPGGQGSGAGHGKADHVTEQRIQRSRRDLTYGKRTTQTGLLRCGSAGGHRPGRPRAVAVRRHRRGVADGADLERGAEADEGRRRGAGQRGDHHRQGIQVRGRGEAAGRQRHLQLHAHGEPHGAVRHQRLGGLGPIIYANNGFKPGRSGSRPPARSSSSSSCSSTIRSPCATRTPPARSTSVGHARHDPAVSRGPAQGHRVMPRVYQQVDWSNGGDGIVVRETVKTMADLRGKTVVLAQNSPSHFFVLNALINAGVQPAEVDFKFTQDAFQAAAAFNADKRWRAW